MSHADYQRQVLDAYWRSVPQQLERLRQENRRLRWLLAIAMVAGTAQWLAQWL